MYGKSTYQIHSQSLKIITGPQVLPNQNCCGQQRQETLITITAQLAAVKSGHQGFCCWRQIHTFLLFCCVLELLT